MKTYSNIGLLFNKHYFNEISYNGDYKNDKNNINLLNNKSKILYNSVLNNTDPLELGNFAIKLMTIYPGLVLGTGNSHESGVKEELKLGFYFDYTTGLPVIPGSSVKGILRSAFEKANGGYVRELIEEISGKVKWEDNDISALEKNIFEGKDAKGNDLSMYKRDIFFDAFPVRSDNPGGKYLANDYITPHKDPLKNPVPLQFLKILPQVTFQFNFRLHDFKDEKGNDLLSAENKKELFKQILLDLGIGAKTNVGYGQFVEDPEQAKKEKLANEKAVEEERKKLKEIERKQKLKEIEKEKKEKENRIKEKGISSMIGNITDYGVLRDKIKEYKEIIKLTETDLFDEKDQDTLLQELNKIIKKKKRKFREKLFNKIKNEAKNWLNEDNINKLNL